jgi:hypothetical protein
MHEVEVLEVPRSRFGRITWMTYLPMCMCGWVGRPPAGYYYTFTGATNVGFRHANPGEALPVSLRLGGLEDRTDQEAETRLVNAGQGTAAFPPNTRLPA